MYKVTLYDRGSYPNGGQVLLDTSSQNVGVKSATYEGKLNEAGSFTFSVTAANPLYNSIESLKTYVSVEEEGYELFWGRVILVRTSPLVGTKQVTCEGAYAFLMDAELGPDSEDVTRTPAAYFNYCIEQFNSQIGNDPARKLLVGTINVTGSDVNTVYKNSNWTEIQSVIKSKIVDLHDGLISITRNGTDHYINWTTQVGITNPQRIQLGKNVVDQNSSESGEDIFTYVRATGKDQITYGPVQLSAAMEAKYGKIIRTINFGDVETVAALQTKTEEYIAKLRDRLTLSVDIKFVDMHYMDDTGQNFALLTETTIAKPSWYTGTWGGHSLNGNYGINQTRGFNNGGAGGFVVTLEPGEYTYSHTYTGSVMTHRVHISYYDGSSMSTILNNAAMTRRGEKFHITFTVPDGAIAVAIRPTTTITPGNSYDLDYIKVEKGNTATDFTPYESRVKVHLGDVFTNIYGYEGTRYTAAALTRDLLNPANDKMTPKTDKDLMPSISSSGANRGSSSGGSSGGRRSLSGSSSHWYRHIHETEEDLALNARNIEITAAENVRILAQNIALNAQNISSVSATTSQLNNKWTAFEGTGLYQNRESINAVAGKFQVDQDGTVVLRQGTDFKIDMNGTSTNVGTLLRLHDNRLNEDGQLLAIYKGSYAYQHNDEIGAIVGRYELDTTVDPVNNPWVNVTPSGDTTGINPKELGWYEVREGRYVKTNDTTVTASKQYYLPGTSTKVTYNVGGGYKIRENGVEYGLYVKEGDNAVLTGGLIVDKINDGSVTTKIKGDRVIIGSELTDDDLATWAADAKNGTGVFAKYFTAQNFNAVIADVELATFGDAATTGDLTIGGSLYVDVDGEPEKINVLDIYFTQNDPNTMHIVYSNGGETTFSKATTQDAAVSSGSHKITVNAKQLNGNVNTTVHSYDVQFGGSYSSNRTTLEVVSNGAPSVETVLGAKTITAPIAINALTGASSQPTQVYPTTVSIAPSGILESLTGNNKIASNGTYTPGEGKIGFSSVVVDVQTGTTLGGQWANGTLTVTATPQGTTETFSIADNTTARTSWSNDKKTATVSVYAATGGSETALDTGKRLTVNAADAYNAGWASAVGKIVLPAEGTSGTFSITLPSSAVDGTAPPKQYTFWELTANVAEVMDNSTGRPIAQLTHNQNNLGYAAAKGSYTTTGGVLRVLKNRNGSDFPLSFAINAGITYDSTTHTYTAKALVDETEMDTEPSGTEAYTQGYTQGQTDLINAGESTYTAASNDDYVLNKYIGTLYVRVPTSNITGLTIDTTNHQIKTSTSSPDQSVTITCERVSRVYTASNNTYAQVFQSKADSSVVATLSDPFVATEAYNAGWDGCFDTKAFTASSASKTLNYDESVTVSASLKNSSGTTVSLGSRTYVAPASLWLYTGGDGSAGPLWPGTNYALRSGGASGTIHGSWYIPNPWIDIVSSGNPIITLDYDTLIQAVAVDADGNIWRNPSGIWKTPAAPAAVTIDIPTNYIYTTAGYPQGTELTRLRNLVRQAIADNESVVFRVDAGGESKYYNMQF